MPISFTITCTDLEKCWLLCSILDNLISNLLHLLSCWHKFSVFTIITHLECACLYRELQWKLCAIMKLSLPFIHTASSNDIIMMLLLFLIGGFAWFEKILMPYSIINLIYSWLDNTNFSLRKDFYWMPIYLGTLPTHRSYKGMLRQTDTNGLWQFTLL